MSTIERGICPEKKPKPTFNVQALYFNDPDEWSRFVSHMNGIFGKAARRKGLPFFDHEVDDIAQEAFYKFSARLPVIQEREGLDPERYIMRVFVNVGYDMLNEKAREERIAEGLKGLDVRSSDDAGARAFSDILPYIEKLRVRRYKEVILLKAAGFSHEEIADKLGVTKENVRQLLHRGIMRLRRLYYGQNTH